MLHKLRAVGKSKTEAMARMHIDASIDRLSSEPQLPE